MRSKNTIKFLFLFFILSGIVVLSMQMQSARAESNGILILQASTYGNGDGLVKGGGLHKSAVELYNNTHKDIDLEAGNYYLHIGSGSEWTSVIKLTGTIPAKSSFLIVSNRPEEVNAMPPAQFPAADIEADFAILNKNFKVALMKNQSTLLNVNNPFGNESLEKDYVDMLAVGNNVNAFETSPFTGQSRPRVPRRSSLVDTDNNSEDFITIDYRVNQGGMPTSKLYKYWPRNSALGAWNPISGLPAIHPEASSIASINYEPIKEIEMLTDLPVIRLDNFDMDSLDPNKTAYTRMAFTLIDHKNSKNNVATLHNQRMRGRGNSTWPLPKKAFRLRLSPRQGLFGEPAHENWVILADYLDPTYMMNWAAFYLGREIFELPFTPTYEHVNVYMNGEYWGIYGLTQHRQADPNHEGAAGRVKMMPQGGWLVELDSYWSEEPKFRTNVYNLPVMIKRTRGIHNAGVEAEWNAFTEKVASADFPENGYRDLINMQSFVDFLLVNEIVWNRENKLPKSTFSYKGENGLISMGPLWDFDQAFYYMGWSDTSDYVMPTHKYFEKSEGRLEMHPFFNRFFEDTVFVKMYKERWKELYPKILATADSIEAIGARIRPSVLENTKRWNTGNANTGFFANYPDNHEEQIAKMATWWRNRVKWLNRVI